MKQTLVVTFFEILTVLTVLAVSTSAQVCSDTVFLRDTTITNQYYVRIPVVLNNPCDVGGFNFVMTTSAPGVLAPKGGDTLDSRLSYHIVIDTTLVIDSIVLPDTFTSLRIDTAFHLPWEYFTAGPGAGVRKDSLYVAAVAAFDTIPPYPLPLERGSGVIFYAKFELPCLFEYPGTRIDTFVEIKIERAFIADPDGHTYNVVYQNANVHFIYDLVRGDANCNGEARGSDVTFLVAYFKGYTRCPCSLRAGDANGDGFVAGNDVIYLVRYFKGFGPPPPPY